MTAIKNLTSIAEFYKTDKLDHGYTNIYEKYFKDIRDEKLKILEIGIADGKGSALLGAPQWLRFFGYQYSSYNRKFELEEVDNNDKLV